MKIHIICGSNSGNAFKAGEIIQSTLQNSLSDSKVLLVDAKDATQDDLACDFLILWGATHGAGQIQKDLVHFFENTGLPIPSEATHGAVFGVGDSRGFPNTFNWIIPQLRLRLEDADIEVSPNLLNIDKDVAFYKEQIEQWSTQTALWIQEIQK